MAKNLDRVYEFLTWKTFSIGNSAMWLVLFKLSDNTTSAGRVEEPPPQSVIPVQLLSQRSLQSAASTWPFHF